MGADQDLEMLRDAYSGWARGDFSRVEMWDPGVEFVVAGVESRTYIGPEGVREGWFDFPRIAPARPRRADHRENGREDTPLLHGYSPMTRR
jgi:hypothetical protein